MSPALVEFTRNALADGIDRADIAEALRQAGWAEADIGAALRSFAEVKFAIPVPRPTPYLSAHEVFLYLVMFTTLYFSAYNFGSLAFDFIDRIFPDPLAYNRYAFDASLRWHVSSLVVAFPLFLLTFRAVVRIVARDPTRRESRPRKWLTYLTLFVASLTLIGDLVILIHSVLGGELTVRFVLKAMTVGTIAGGIFAYFYADVRSGEEPT